MASASIFNDIKRNDFPYNWRRPQVTPDQPPLQINDRVVWISDFGPEHGTVRWIGKLAEMGTNWTVGVDLDNPIGTTDGHWGGRQLFMTRPKHGLIISILALMKEEEFLGVPTAGTTREETYQEKRTGFGLYDNVKYKVNNEVPQLAPVPDDDIPFADEVECSQPEVLALQLAANIAAGRAEPVNAGANEKPDLQDEQDIYKWYDAMDFGSKKHMRPHKTLQSNASLSSSLGDMEEVSSVVSEDDESPKEKGGFLSSLFRWLWKGKPKKRKPAQETEQNLVRVPSGSIHSVTSTSSSFQYVPMDFTLDKKKIKDNQKSAEKIPKADLPVDLNSDDLSETGTFKIITDTTSKPETTKESLNDKIDLEEMPTLKLPVPEGVAGKKSPNRSHPPYKSKNVVRSRSTGTYRRKKRRAPLPPNFELKLGQRKDSDELADASNENKKKRIAYVKGKRRAPSPPPVKKNQGTSTGQEVHIGSIENIELKDDESILSTAEEVSLSSLPSSPSLKVTRNAAVNTTLDKSSGTVSTISGDSTHSQTKPSTVSTATNTTISRTTGNSTSKKPEMVSIATNTTLVKPDFPSEPNHIKSLMEFPPFPHPRLKLIERKKLFSKCASLSSSPKLKKARSEPGLDTKNSFDSDDDMDFPIGQLGYDVTTTTSNDEYRPLSVIKSKQSNIKASSNSQAEENKSYEQSSKITEREENISLGENQLVKEDKRNKNDNLQLHPVVTEEWKGRGLSTQKLINMFNALSAATLERQEKPHNSSAHIRKLSVDKEFAEMDIHSTALQQNKKPLQKDNKTITDSDVNGCLKQQNTNLLRDDPNQLTVYFNQPKASELSENSIDDEDDEVDANLLYVNVVPLNSDTAAVPQASPRRTVDQGGRTYTNLRDFHLLQESTSLDTEEPETDVNMYENLADLALESLDEDDKNKLEVALAESESDSDLSEPVVYENIKQMEEDLQKEAKASQISSKQAMDIDVDSDDSDLNEPVVYENIRQIEEKTARKTEDLQKKMKVADTSVKEHMDISEDGSDDDEPVVYENIKQIEEESRQKKTDSQKEIKIPEMPVKAHINIDEDSDNDIDEPIVYENIRQFEDPYIENKELKIAESLISINEDSDDDINEPIVYENIRQLEEMTVQKTDDPKKKVKASETLAKQPVNVDSTSDNGIAIYTKENRTADFLKKSSWMEPTLPGIYENIEGIQGQLQSNFVTSDSKSKNVNKFPKNSLDSRYKSAENIKESKTDQKSDLPSNSNLVKGHSMDLQKGSDAFSKNGEWEKRSDRASATDRTVRNSESSHNPVQMQSISRPYYRSWSGDLNRGDQVFMDRYHENQANITASGFIPTNEAEFAYLPNRRVSMETALSCMSLAGPTPPITPRKGGRKYRQRRESEYSKLSQTLPVKKHNYSSNNSGMTQLQDTAILCKSVNDLKVKEHKDNRDNPDDKVNFKSDQKIINPTVTNCATKQNETKTVTCHKLNSDLHKDSETNFNLYKFSNSQGNYINPGKEEVSPFSFSNPFYMSSSQIKQLTSTDSINSPKPLKTYHSEYKLNTPPFYVYKQSHSATLDQGNEIKEVNIQDKASGSSTAFVNTSGLNNSNFNGSHSLITVTVSTTQAETNRNNRINSVTTSPPLSSPFDVAGKPLANTLPSVKKDPTYDISRQLVSKTDEKPPRRKDPTYGSSKKLVGKTVELTSINTEPNFDNSAKLIPDNSEITAPRRSKIYSASRTVANKSDEKPLPKKDRTYDSVENLVTTADLVSTPKREKVYDISKKINAKCNQKLFVDEEHSIRITEKEEAPKTIPRTKNRTSNPSHYQDVQQGKLVLERMKGPGQQHFLKIVEGDSPSVATITDPGEKLYDSTDTSKGAIKKSRKAVKSGVSNSKKKSHSKSNLTEATISEKKSEVPDLSLELTNDSDIVGSKSPEQSPKLPKPPIVNRTVKQEAMKKRSNTVPSSIWPESYEILAPELIKLKAKLQGNPETGELSGLPQKDVSTLQVNKLLRKLEVAIQKGQHEQAAVLAKDLAMLKVSCSVVRNKPKNIPVNSESISINLFVEDRSSHIGPINLQVVPSMTVGQLKRKIEQQFEFPADLQRWILGKKLASNDEATLASYDVITSGCPVFLYLMESDPDIVGRYKQRLEMYLRALEEFEDNMENEYPVIEKGLKPRPSPRSIIGTPIPKPRSNPKIYSQVATKQQHTLEVDVDKKEPRRITGWSCPACTFLNVPTRPGCQVCGENRPEDFIIPEGYEVLPDEAERIKKEKALEEQLKKAQEEERQANYRRLLELDDVDVVINDEEFECPVCFSEVAKGDGVRLRDCLHMFCRICIENAVQFSEVAEVKCPYMDDHYSCPSVIQDREVRALVSPEIYERHLHKSMVAAESQAANSFHCKTADCRGWCVYEDNVNEFLCPVCNHTNCLTCQAIHEGLNCRQYQDKVEYEAASSEEAKKTKDALDQMLEEGQAMRCPKCQVILMKKWGCDWLKCSMCQTEICWVTKGPRWGPAGQGDISGGCMCGVNGVRCHPKCNYCH